MTGPVPGHRIPDISHQKTWSFGNNEARYMTGLFLSKIYLTSLERAIWERNIYIEIILNNTGPIPIDFSIIESAYEEGLE